MEKINGAWKNASEEMYKAQQEAGAQPGADAGADQGASDSTSGSGADDVQDVEFEEVDDSKK